MIRCLMILFFVTISFAPYYVLSYDAPFNTTVMGITKDSKTSLHKVLNLLIDLDAPFTWEDCIMKNPPTACGIQEGCKFPIGCTESYCKEARSYINPTCPSLNNMTAKYGCKICAVTPFNPISKSCKISQLTGILLDLAVTNGRNPSYSWNTFMGMDFKVSCAPQSLLRSFPKGVYGVAAFSWSNLAFPRQVYYPAVADKFALCLPSSSMDLGVTFLGEGPFYFTNFPNLDLRTILSYTPMVRKAPKSLGYYIGINRILVNGKPILLPAIKTISVKLSTLVTYTTLRSDIYKSLTTSFAKATKDIPRVNAVKPFSLCLKSSAIGSARTKFRVPNMDLVTESGKKWTISGDNLMKRTGNGLACLAFIDGGLKVKDPIVIGTFQMENNFLFFDLENQKLGFSSSLLTQGTSCSSFNFTMT